MTGLRLVIFDVDGTLVDSQATILAAMQAGFAAVGRLMPERATALSVVGLSLPIALARLAPDALPAEVEAMVQAYKAAFHAQRSAQGVDHAPFYPGMRALLDGLARQDRTLLGAATGKSRRGLAAMIAAHGLDRHFVTLQTADDHPSKPHPAMIAAALAEAGVDPAEAVMIGDTVYDIDMARAAGVPAIAVTWGYHAPEMLRGADRVVTDPAALMQAIDDLIGEPV